MSEEGEVLEKLTSPAGQHAGARSRAYAAFAEVFEYPDKEYFEAVRSGAKRRMTSPSSSRVSSTWAARALRARSTAACTAARG